MIGKTLLNGSMVRQFEEKVHLLRHIIILIPQKHYNILHIISFFMKFSVQKKDIQVQSFIVRFPSYEFATYSFKESTSLIGLTNIVYYPQFKCTISLIYENNHSLPYYYIKDYSFSPPKVKIILSTEEIAIRNFQSYFDPNQNVQPKWREAKYCILATIFSNFLPKFSKVIIPNKTQISYNASLNAPFYKKGEKNYQAQLKKFMIEKDIFENEFFQKSLQQQSSYNIDDIDKVCNKLKLSKISEKPKQLNMLPQFKDQYIDQASFPWIRKEGKCSQFLHYPSFVPIISKLQKKQKRQRGENNDLEKALSAQKMMKSKTLSPLTQVLNKNGSQNNRKMNVKMLKGMKEDWIKLYSSIRMHKDEQPMVNTTEFKENILGIMREQIVDKMKNQKKEKMQEYMQKKVLMKFCSSYQEILFIFQIILKDPQEQDFKKIFNDFRTNTQPQLRQEQMMRQDRLQLWKNSSAKALGILFFILNIALRNIQDVFKVDEILLKPEQIKLYEMEDQQQQLIQQIQKLQNQASILKKEDKSLLQSIQSKKDSLHKLQREQSQMKATLKSQTKQILEKDLYLKQLQQKLIALDREISKKQRQINEKLQLMIELDGQIKQKKVIIEQKDKIAKNLDKKIEEATQIQLKINQAIQDVKKKEDQERQKLDLIKIQLGKMGSKKQKQQTVLREQKQKVQKQIVQSRKKIAQLEILVTEITDQYKRSEKKLKNCDQMLSDKRNHLKMLKQEVQKHQNSESQSLRSCKKMEKIKKNLSIDIKKLQISQEWLKKSIRELQETMKVQQQLFKQHEENNKCCLCWQSPSTNVMIPCGHLCICCQCMQEKKLQQCPYCRQKGKLYKIFIP